MLVSVIITTYKRPLLLRRALESIDLKINEIEVLVVDDDPDMNAAKVVCEFSTVRYISKRGINQGLSISRNIGIEFSLGRYLIFLDDDDYFSENAIQKFIQNIDGRTEFYYGDLIYKRKDADEYYSQAAVISHKLLVGNTIPIGSYMIDKSCLVDGFDMGMRSHEDWEFLLKNVKWQNSKYINHIMVNIDKTSENEDSMQNRRRKMFWIDYLQVYSKYPNDELARTRSEVLRGLGVSIPFEMLLFNSTH